MEVDHELCTKVVECLCAGKKKICTAESCTGGLVAASLVAVPGASDVMDMSFVTYSNEAKSFLIGVDPVTIEEHGVVSREVAAEMCRLAAIKAGAEVGISTTGIAGPDGGTPETPVGTVFAGIAIRTPKRFDVTVKELHLTGDRNEVRVKTVNEIMKVLFEMLR